jgi:deoxyribonuclease IV
MSVYNLRWEVGAHTAFEKRICDTLWTSINYGMYCTQFYMGAPRGFDRASIDPDDITECKKILRRFPMHVFTHFPVVANFAGSVKTLAWSGNPEQDRKTSHILHSLEYELSIVSDMDAKSNGVVIHPGNFPDRKKGLEAIISSINKINFPPKCKLVLENSAGQGDSLGTTFQELKTIIDGVDEKKREHIGVCIDTCHIYAYGGYDLSTVAEVERMFQEFDDLIGLRRLSLIHLNDSESQHKTRVDRHACLGAGHIWKHNFTSLIYLLDRIKDLGVPAVLETHGLDMKTLACL